MPTATFKTFTLRELRCFSRFPEFQPMGEVLAPDGYRFIDGCHAMMVWDDAEKAELMSPEALEICPQDCDCKE